MWLHESGRRYAPEGEDPGARTTTSVPKRSRGVSSVPASAVIWNHGCTLPALWIHISFTLVDGFNMKDGDELLSKSPRDGTFTWARSDERIISDNSPSGRMLGSGGAVFHGYSTKQEFTLQIYVSRLYWSSKRKQSCNYPNSGCISLPKKNPHKHRKNIFFYMSISIYIYIYGLYMFQIIFIIYVRTRSHNLFTHVFFYYS